MLISWKDKSNQNSITYPVNQASITFNQNTPDTSLTSASHQNNPSQQEFKSISLGNNNSNNNNFKSIDSYKPQTNLVYDTKTISNIDTKLYNLLKK